MPFFIPCVAIGAGVSLVVWGSIMILDNDDSSDEAVAEILSRVPETFREFIDRVSIDSSGIHITFKKNTPKRIMDEIKNNIGLG